MSFTGEKSRQELQTGRPIHTAAPEITFEDVVDLDCPGIRKKQKGDGSVNMDCPFCKGSMKFNFRDDPPEKPGGQGKHVGHCVKCGVGFNHITFHAAMTGMSNKEAYADLREQLGQMTPEQREAKAKREEEKRKEQENRIVPAPLGIRSWNYELLLSKLSLSDAHVRELNRRGLTQDLMKKYDIRIRSFPMLGGTELVRAVSTETTLATYCLGTKDKPRSPRWQIPGFVGWGEKATLTVPYRSCFLIPIVTANGEISCFQMRFDKPEDLVKAEDAEKLRAEKAAEMLKAKQAAGIPVTEEDLKATHPQKVEKSQRYCFWSSGSKKDGVSVSGCENIHHVGFDFDKWETPETVFLTEGCLKADVAAALTGQPFIAVMGVNNTRQLPDELKRLKDHGTKRIKLCFDMDYLDNKNVEGAMRTVEQMIRDAGLEASACQWDRRYKGIDDYALYRHGFGDIGQSNEDA